VTSYQELTRLAVVGKAVIYLVHICKAQQNYNKIAIEMSLRAHLVHVKASNHIWKVFNFEKLEDKLNFDHSMPF